MSNAIRSAAEHAVAEIVRAELSTPREIAAAARQARDQLMREEFARYEAAGRHRDAAKLVAKKFAADPRDPIELHNIAQMLRRWRRNETHSVRLPAAKSFTEEA